mgnify:CR=1 FL=1
MRRFLPVVILLALGACASSPPARTVNRVQTQPVPTATVVEQGPFNPNAYLRTCYGIRVSNSPLVDREGWVLNFKPIILVDGVVLAAVPSNDVCLTSGFGNRFNRKHDGIDLQSRPAGPVYATAPGRILEARNATGYGLQVVIDHGKGVYTRYAHLAYIDPAVRPGAKIGFGQPVGMMGNTGNASAIHVHYEILTGNYNTPRGSKGLTTRDPFSFPPYEYAEAY